MNYLIFYVSKFGRIKTGYCNDLKGITFFAREYGPVNVYQENKNSKDTYEYLMTVEVLK